MAECNIPLRKILAKECTQSLAYRDGVFSFPVREYLSSERLRAMITSRGMHFASETVNAILGEFKRLHTMANKHSIDSICLGDLLVGEVMEAEIASNASAVRMMKVARNVLLIEGGGEVEISDDFRLAAGVALSIGVVERLRMLTPRIDHIVLSDVYIGSFYRRAIADDLRSLVDEAQSIINKRGDCTPLLRRAKELHIGAFQLLNLLNLSCNGLS
ncbi:MAG: hypothetical protein ACI4AM_02755 [Muribaculaceae bacterium]